LEKGALVDASTVNALSSSGLVHTVTCTAANVADVTETANLPHGQGQAVDADSGYLGADKRDELKDCDVTWYIAEKGSDNHRRENLR
jgi:IS5 family transposase